MPIPIDIKDPPGDFFHIISDEGFYIASLQKKSQTYRHDVLDSVQAIDNSVWALFFAVVFCFCGLFQLPIGRRAVRKVKLNLFEVIFQVFATIFGKIWTYQTISGFRMFQTLSGLLILLFMAGFNSTFSTQVVIRDQSKPIETLEDIVKSNRPPIFVDGESRYDLFFHGAARIYRHIFRLAREHETDEPVPFDAFYIYQRLVGDGHILLASDKLTRIGIPWFRQFYQDEGLDDYLHVSSQPYHKSLVAHISKPRLKEPLNSEFKRRYSRQ